MGIDQVGIDRVGIVSMPKKSKNKQIFIDRVRNDRLPTAYMYDMSSGFENEHIFFLK